MNLNDLELSHGTCSACGRVDLLPQRSVGDGGDQAGAA